MEHSKMCKDGQFSRNLLKARSKLEKSMEILMEHQKMRKDAPVLRNRDLKMKIVELDVGFPVVVSKMRKDAQFSRNRQKTITKCPYSKYVLLELGELFNFIITRTLKIVSLSNIYHSRYHY